MKIDNLNKMNDAFSLLSRAGTAVLAAGAITLSASASDNCPGDFDCSGRVDSPDIASLLASWGTAGADLNGDGTTNALDIAALLVAWGPCATCVNTSWLEGYGADPVLGNTVRTMIEFDDGTGSKLWFGGLLRDIAGVPASDIAQWDGTRFSIPSGGLTTTLGALLTAEVYDLEVFNGELYAAGTFNQSTGIGTVNGVARWDGAAWQPLGSGVQMTDGTGGFGYVFEVYQGQLYLGGRFDFAGGQPAANIARWNGSDWSAVDIGVGGSIYALDSFVDGANNWLVAGGVFTRAGSVSGGTTGFVANRIARWSPTTSWQPFVYVSGGTTYTGLPSIVYALESTSAGGVPALYVGGAFDDVGGNAAADRVVRWSGNAWGALASGLTGSDVNGIFLAESSGGLEIYVAGNMTGNIRQFNGTAWANLDTGLSGVGSRAYTIERGSYGFLVGGSFASGSGRTINRLALWNGSVWSPLLTGMVGDVATILPMPGTGGSQVFLGGAISQAGGRVVSNAVVWNGSSYGSLGGGVTNSSGTAVVNAAVEFQGSLIVAGSFTHAGSTQIPASNIARWTGTGWSQLLGGVNGPVTCLLVVDNELYVGGSFANANGQPETSKLARWNGSVWSSVAPTTVPTPVVKALALYQGKLYVGGSNAGTGFPPLHRLDGSAWSALLGPYNGLQFFMPINDMKVVDFNGCAGGGEYLAIGGTFTELMVDGQPVTGTGGVALWDGTQWHGTGLRSVSNFTVRSLAVYPDGAGESLVIGGTFASIAGVPADRVAYYDGGAWFPMSAAFPGSAVGSAVVRSVGIISRNGKPEVMVGGSFRRGPGGSSCVASWGCRD